MVSFLHWIWRSNRIRFIGMTISSRREIVHGMPGWQKYAKYYHWIFQSDTRGNVLDDVYWFLQTFVRLINRMGLAGYSQCHWTKWGKKKTSSNSQLKSHINDLKASIAIGLISCSHRPEVTGGKKRTWNIMLELSKLQCKLNSEPCRVYF